MFEKPKAEVIKFDLEDICTTSGDCEGIDLPIIPDE